LSLVRDPGSDELLKKQARLLCETDTPKPARFSWPELFETLFFVLLALPHQASTGLKLEPISIVTLAASWGYYIKKLNRRASKAIQREIEKPDAGSEDRTGGTLFLDEVGLLSPFLQAKLLRALQQREIDRIGGRTPIPIDIRLIAATNRNLEGAVAEGDFREDLYYRLNVVTIRTPPLRERPEDIPLLVRYFISLCSKRNRARRDRHFSRSGRDSFEAPLAG
jgi:DNA-binding NtrC family response regulator